MATDDMRKWTHGERQAWWCAFSACLGTNISYALAMGVEEKEIRDELEAIFGVAKASAVTAALDARPLPEIFGLGAWLKNGRF